MPIQRQITVVAIPENKQGGGATVQAVRVGNPVPPSPAIATVSVKDTQVVTVPATISIKDFASCHALVSIQSDLYSVPTNALCIHLGQGVVYFTWQGDAWRYRLYGSKSLNSGYRLISDEIEGERYTLRGAPLNTKLYFRVTSLGQDGSESEHCQVARGTFTSKSYRMKVTTIRGSVISKGAIFSKIDKTSGMMISFQCPDERTIN